MKIIDNITTRNYTKGNNRSIKYIVIHYVGAVSSAKNNAVYFKNTYRGASAHYFVDENDIYRVVEDKNIAWHCGTTGKYYHSICRNSNSIGIEMCCYKKNGKLDISDKVVERTIELVKGLMSRYNIPASNVIRHYDVTHKNCPAPFVSDHTRWDNFKAKLNSNNTSSSFKTYKVKITANVLNVRAGAGTNYKINTTVKKGYIYTIIDEKNGWGKLKSGAGWIKLSYTKKI